MRYLVRIRYSKNYLEPDKARCHSGLLRPSSTANSSGAKLRIHTGTYACRKKRSKPSSELPDLQLQRHQGTRVEEKLGAESATDVMRSTAIPKPMRTGVGHRQQV